jgi:hypothetical protein
VASEALSSGHTTIILNLGWWESGGAVKALADFRSSKGYSDAQEIESSAYVKIIT